MRNQADLMGTLPNLDHNTIQQESSRFEKIANLGRTALDLAGSYVSYIGEKVKAIGNATRHDLTPLAVSAAAIAMTAEAIVDVPIAAGRNISDIAREANSPSPKPESNNSNPTKKASSIHFYSVSDKRPYEMLPKKLKKGHCLPGGNELQVNPNTNVNRPDGRVHNKFAKAWIDYPVKNNRETLRTEIKKGKTVCFGFVATRNRNVYYIDRKDFRYRKNSHTNRTIASYIDPFKIGDSPSPSMHSVVLYYRNTK